MSDALKIDELWNRLESDPASAEEVRSAAGDVDCAPARLLAAVAAFDMKDFPAARDGFARVLTEQPSNLVAAQYEVLALFASGDAPGAASRLRDLPRLPVTPCLRRLVALFWPLRRTTGLGRTPAGPEPTDVPFSADYARFTSGAKCTDGRRRHLAERHLQAGLTAFFSNKYRLAELLFQRSYRIFPESIDTCVPHAMMLAAHGDEEEALSVLDHPFREAADAVLGDTDKGIMFPPDLASAWASAKTGLGAHAEALAALSLVKPQGPDDWGSHWVASLAYLGLGDELQFRKFFSVATGPYFIDTWEQRIRPFTDRLQAWLETEDAAEAARRTAESVGREFAGT